MHIPIDYEKFVRNGASIKHIVPFQTEKICEIAVERDPWEIQHVRKDLRKLQLWLKAIRINPRVIVHAQKEEQTPEMVDLAFKNVGNRTMFPINRISPDLLTRDMYAHALKVQACDDTWKCIPEKFRDAGMYAILGAALPDTISNMGEHFRTSEWYTEVLTINPCALEYIPFVAQTYTHCKIAVSRKGKMLRFANPALHSPELYTIAVRENCRAIAYVPREKITPKLFKIAVFGGAWKEHELNELAPWDTTELYISILRYNGEIIKFIDPSRHTARLCRMAIKNSSENLVPYFHPRFQTKEFIMLTIEKNPYHYYRAYCWSNCLSYRNILRIVSRDGTLLQYVPKKFHDERLCYAAVCSHSTALKSACVKSQRMHEVVFNDFDGLYMLKHANPRYLSYKLIFTAMKKFMRKHGETALYHCITYNGCHRDIHPYIRPYLTPKLLLWIERHTEGQYHSILQHLMSHQQFPELCEAAVIKGVSIKFIREDLRSPRITYLAAVHRGKLLRQDANVTPEIVSLAIENSGKNFEFYNYLFNVDKKFQTPELAKMLLTTADHDINDLRQDLHSTEMYEISLRNRSDNLRHHYYSYQPRFMTKDMYVRAILEMPQVAKHIPLRFCAGDVWRAIVESKKYYPGLLWVINESCPGIYARIMRDLGLIELALDAEGKFAIDPYTGEVVDHCEYNPYL